MMLNHIATLAAPFGPLATLAAPLGPGLQGIAWLQERFPAFAADQARRHRLHLSLHVGSGDRTGVRWVSIALLEPIHQPPAPDLHWAAYVEALVLVARAQHHARSAGGRGRP